jgi:hypothetical protein
MGLFAKLRAAFVRVAPLDDPVRQAIGEIDALVARFAHRDVPQDVAPVHEVIEKAIAHGAPIWNAGSRLGCAQIYLHAARRLVADLPPARGNDPTVRGIELAAYLLGPIVRDTTQATSDNATALAWRLRHAFDAVLHSPVRDHGMDMVDEILTAAGSTPTAPSLIRTVLLAAIAHGNVLYRQREFHGIAVLHRHTADRLVERIRREPDPTAPCREVLAKLRPGVATGRHVEPGDEAEQVATVLYETFVEILDGQEPDSPPAAAAATDRFDAFMSYRREGGAETARLIKLMLEKHGLKVFLDVECLNIGHTFDDRLLDAIDRSSGFLLILSVGALDRCASESDWVRREILHATRCRRKIIPLAMPGFEFPKDLPAVLDHLPRIQWVEYSRQHLDAVVQMLAAAIRSE